MRLLAKQNLIKNGSYINGQWHCASQRIEVTNPATGETITQVSNATAVEAETAVIAAKDSLKKWSAKSACERSNILRKWYELINIHQQELGEILTLEQGKPLTEAIGEIKYGASFIEWFAEEAKRVYGDTVPSPGSDNRILVLKQPIGVVAAITPWNFPNAMIARKAAAALAAGCTFVGRPATQTPLSALSMAALAEEAGIPAGVFNIVVGEDSSGIGKILTEHPDVAKFTFTGSTPIGKLLTKQCASSVKRVSMELGGNAPFIIFEDADIEAAVEGLITSKYRNAGQTCVCTNRIFVHEAIQSRFLEKFVSRVTKLKMGNGIDPGVHIGPLINNKAVQAVDKLLTDSVAMGAKVVLGGTPSAQHSNFYPPTIVTGVTTEMPLAQNEIFGPISAFITFSDEKEVIDMANDTEYGLAAYFYSRDIGRIWRVSEQLEYGMVGVNEGLISNAAAPFGGMKQSGNGREGSKYGLDDYLEIKYLCLGGIEQ